MLYFGPRTPPNLQPQMYQIADDQLKILEAADPTDPRLCYLRVGALAMADKNTQAKEQAREAQRLNEATTDPRRKLSPLQEGRIRDWLFTEKK
jgi:hypothetical protein